MASSSPAKKVGQDEMVGLFKDMRLKEARQYLVPHVNRMRTETGSGPVTKQHPKLRDLQQLAVHWKLNKRAGFWSDCAEEEPLLMCLHKHAMKVDKEEAARARARAAEKSNGRARGASVAIDVDTSDDETEDWRERLARLNADKPDYKGDLFGTRGDYDGGLIYASRRPGGAAGLSPQQARAPAPVKKVAPAATTESGETSEEPSEDKAASTMEKLKIASTTTLRDMSAKEDVRADLANTPAVQSCYDLWRTTPNADVKRNCAMTLTNLYTTLPMDRDEFLAPVLDLGQTEGSDAVVATCARALLNRYLSKRPVHVSHLTATISAVRAMERRCDAATRVHLAHIICVMLSNTTDEGERLDKDGEPYVSQAASERIREVAVHDGLLPVLVMLAGPPLDEDRQEYCAVAFNKLADVLSIHSELSGRAVLPAIVALLSSLNSDISDNAAIALFELTCSPDSAVSERLVRNKSVARSLMGVAIDQGKIVDGASDPKFNPADAYPMGRRATAAMLRMSVDPELLPIMVENGVAPMLFAWFHKGDDIIKHNAVVALCNLYTCTEGQKQLVDLGFAQVIIQAADIKVDATPQAGESMEEAMAAAAEAEKADIGVRKRCSHALFLLSQGGEDLASHLIENGAVDALVKLSQTKDADTLLNSVRSLQHLSEKEAAHDTLCAGGAISVFTKYSKAKDLEVLRACTLGLCNMANTPNSHSELLSNDAIAVLVRLVASTGIKSPCVRAFCQLSAYRPAHQKLIEHAVLPLFIAQSRLTKSELRRDCAQAMYNLSCVESREAVMLSEGVPSALTIVALFRTDDAMTKDLCAAALFNLMYDPAGRQSLVDDGVLWAFIKLALASNDGSDSVGAEEGMDALLATLKLRAAKSPSPEGKEEKDAEGETFATDTRQTCTRLIRNLALDKGLVRQTAEKRTLSALAKFSRLPDPETRFNCVVALCEMTRHRYLHKALVERGAMTILLRLAVADDIAVSHRVAVALYRLVQSIDSRQMVGENRDLSKTLIGLNDTVRAEMMAFGGHIASTSTDACTSAPKQGLPLDSKEAHQAHALLLLRIICTIACNVTAVTESRVQATANGMFDVILQLEGYEHENTSIITNEHKARQKKERESKTRSTGAPTPEDDSTPRSVTSPESGSRSLAFGAAWLAKTGASRLAPRFTMPPAAWALRDPACFRMVASTLLNLTSELEVCSFLDGNTEEGVVESAVWSTRFLLSVIAEQDPPPDGDAGVGINSDMVCTLVLASLTNLSKFPNISGNMFADDLVTDLITIARKHPAPDVQAGIATTIANLIYNNAMRPLSKENMASIVELMTLSTRTGQHPMTMGSYIFISWILTRFPKQTLALVKGGVLEAIVALTKRLEKPLRNSDEAGAALFADKRRQALHWELVSVVAAINGFEEYRERLFEVPGLIAAVVTYSNATRLVTRSAAVEVLTSLTKYHDHRKLLVDNASEGAIAMLIEKANNVKEDPGIREECARALQRLSSDEELSQDSSLQEGGLVQSVLSVLSKADVEAAEGKGAEDYEDESDAEEKGEQEEEEGEIPDNVVRVPRGPLKIYPTSSLVGEAGYSAENGAPIPAPIEEEGNESYLESRSQFFGDTQDDGVADWKKITDLEGLPKKEEPRATRDEEDEVEEAKVDAKPSLGDSQEWQRSPRASGGQLPPLSDSPAPPKRTPARTPEPRSLSRNKGAQLDPISNLKSPMSSITRKQLAKRQAREAASAGGLGATGLSDTRMSRKSPARSRGGAGRKNPTASPIQMRNSQSAELFGKPVRTSKKGSPGRGKKAGGRSVVMDHVEETYGIKGGAM